MSAESVTGSAGVAVRLGIESVRNVGDALAERIAERRPYSSMEDLVRRTGAPLPAVEALATAGAFGCFDTPRREALWEAGAVSQSSPGRLPGVVVGTDSPPLPPLTEPETAAADLWSTGISADRHPVQFARPRLDEMGAVSAAGLAGRPLRTTGGGGRPGHPPPAAGHRGRDHLRQPGGRDRHAQRHLPRPRCGPPTGGWPRRRPPSSSGAAWNGPRGSPTSSPSAIEPLSLAVESTRSRDFR